MLKTSVWMLLICLFAFTLLCFATEVLGNNKTVSITDVSKDGTLAIEGDAWTRCLIHLVISRQEAGPQNARLVAQVANQQSSINVNGLKIGANPIEIFAPVRTDRSEETVTLKLYDGEALLDERKSSITYTIPHKDFRCKITRDDYNVPFINENAKKDAWAIIKGKLARPDTVWSRFFAFIFETHSLNFRINNYQPSAQIVVDFLNKTAAITLNGNPDDPIRKAWFQQSTAALQSTAFAYKFIKPANLLTVEQEASIDAMLKTLATYVTEHGETGGAMNRGCGAGCCANAVLDMFPRDKDAPVWKKYADSTWNVFWKRQRDTDEDCTGYGGVFLQYLIPWAEVRHMEKAFYANNEVHNMFERFRKEVSPLGIIPNTGAQDWGAYYEYIPAFEKAASVYHDGKFKWAAHRLFNYAVVQNPARLTEPGIYFMEAYAFARAYAYADEDVEEEIPQTRSVATIRGAQKDPDKLIMRTGYGVDDAYCLLDLFNLGGKGDDDGSSIKCYMDDGAVLLRATGSYKDVGEQDHNFILIRRLDESFPVMDSLYKPNVWYRYALELNHPYTSSGGPQAYLDRASNLFFRLEGEGEFDLLVDDVKADGPRGARMDKSYEREAPDETYSNDSHGGRRSLLEHLNFDKFPRIWIDLARWPSRADLAQFKTLEFWWKANSVDLTSLIFGVNGDGTSRWHFQPVSLRLSNVRKVKDFSTSVYGIVDVVIKDYLGDDLKQERMLALCKDKFLWVRDTVTFDKDESCQIGPLWNVQHLAGSGENWFDTFTHALTYNYKQNVWTTNPQARNLLVYFVPVSNADVGMMDTHPELGVAEKKNRANNYCLYQKWQGDAQAGSTLRFNSILIPHTIDVAPQTLADDIKLIYDKDDATFIRIGDSYVLMNPSGSDITSSVISTDCTYLLLETREGKAVHISGEEGTHVDFKGNTIFASGTKTDVDKNIE